MNDLQRAQVAKQLAAHQHENYRVNIERLENFLVMKGVMRPELMTSRLFADFLALCKRMIRGTRVLDVGCGTGILGITMAKVGAREVVLSDIDERAVENARINVREQCQGVVTVVCSDLFAEIDGVFDVIVFNHPFFDVYPAHRDVSASMFGGGGLIHRFFEQAKVHLEQDGVIIMPYLKLAGEANDPIIQGPRHGYKARQADAWRACSGLQQGVVTVTFLRL